MLNCTLKIYQGTKLVSIYPPLTSPVIPMNYVCTSPHRDSNKVMGYYHPIPQFQKLNSRLIHPIFTSNTTSPLLPHTTHSLFSISTPQSLVLPESKHLAHAFLKWAGFRLPIDHTPFLYVSTCTISQQPCTDLLASCARMDLAEQWSVSFKSSDEVWVSAVAHINNPAI